MKILIYNRLADEKLKIFSFTMMFVLYKAQETREVEDYRVKSTIYGDMWEGNS